MLCFEWSLSIHTQPISFDCSMWKYYYNNRRIWSNVFPWKQCMHWYFLRDNTAHWAMNISLDLMVPCVLTKVRVTIKYLTAPVGFYTLGSYVVTTSGISRLAINVMLLWKAAICWLKTMILHNLALRSLETKYVHLYVFALPNCPLPPTVLCIYLWGSHGHISGYFPESVIYNSPRQFHPFWYSNA